MSQISSFVTSNPISFALTLLRQLGNTKPSPQQIQLITQLTTQILVPQQPHSVLTQRERICLSLAAKGHTSQQTARIMGIAKTTVETYRKEIKRKLGCQNITQAVFEGVQQGYLMTVNTTPALQNQN